MKKVRKLGLISIMIVVISALLVQAYLIRGSQLTTIKYDQPQVHYSSTPTLLIPGWGGNSWTYQKLIQQTARQNVAQHTMTVWVSPNGHVRVKGSVQGKKNALIQLLYTWNYSPTYHPQVRQLKRVLLVLAREYHVHDLNIIAHSYGGTEWLHVYIANRQIQQQINFHRVILLGAPADETFGARTKYTKWLFKKSSDPNFLALERQIQTVKLQSDDYIYNWMGQNARGTDGEVPTVQSEMLASLIKNKRIHYQQRIFPHTSHTALHQKKVILTAISNVLWH
ncbi:alpha/beta hydrolase [Lactobacillus sp. 3B(2020)]|uniref:alpha/beta hydrolase n=1 Tax=Lactobacillus sp. 3B(2020) TaxID=2695882 RepID=UPI0015DEB006|nr:alpha/beta hydrolase [Lactobacillus sp. 3B(2020)]QLL69971.1 alpha/beta hydrolase [Lactobacillus sp. 3B(2020)]